MLLKPCPKMWRRFPKTQSEVLLRYTGGTNSFWNQMHSIAQEKNPAVAGRVRCCGTTVEEGTYSEVLLTQVTRLGIGVCTVAVYVVAVPSVVVGNHGGAKLPEKRWS